MEEVVTNFDRLEQVGTPNYQIIVHPLTSGYTVQIGCQSFAVESVESLIYRLSAYLRNPEKVISDWTEFGKLPS